MKIFSIKYLFLLAALGFSIFVLLFKNSFTWNMLYLVSGLSFLYMVTAIAEYIAIPREVKVDKKKFIYFTPGMISKKGIRIGGFIIATSILLFSGIKVLLFGIVLAALLVSEIISVFVIIKKKMYFIYFEDKAVVFNEDRPKRVFASHISEIEYRYEIFYLTLKNNQVRMIETEKVEEADRTEFIKEFVFWATTYQIPFTDEAKGKLGIV